MATILRPEPDGLVWPLPEQVRLVDGTSLLVRELTSDDVPRLRRLHSRLSPATIYRRFMSPCPSPSERVLRYLTDLDHLDREALVAAAGDEIHAVARYHHLMGTDEAEVAVVVEDRWQRRGIARVLFERLAGLAQARGLAAFTGSMLGDNLPARSMLVALFPEAQRRVDNGEIVFRVPLPTQPDWL